LGSLFVWTLESFSLEEKKEEGVVVLVLKMIVEYQLKKYH